MVSGRVPCPGLTTFDTEKPSISFHLWSQVIEVLSISLFLQRREKERDKEEDKENEESNMVNGDDEVGYHGNSGNKQPDLGYHGNSGNKQ